MPEYVDELAGRLPGKVFVVRFKSKPRLEDGTLGRLRSVFLVFFKRADAEKCMVRLGTYTKEPGYGSHELLVADLDWQPVLGEREAA